MNNTETRLAARTTLEALKQRTRSNYRARRSPETDRHEARLAALRDFADTATRGSSTDEFDELATSSLGARSADYRTAYAETLAALAATFAEKSRRATAEPATFTCECGEHEYPIVLTDNDESIWCECGQRIEPQRARAERS
jgi:hypothetical protein